MDEKNAYIELVKQNRAKHRAKLKASKEIKELEQKKEKVILKYEQAAKDNTCITFHQYCRKKWASEAGIESVPDDDETDVEWQEKLNAKQKEEDAWEDVPDVGNGLKRVNGNDFDTAWLNAMYTDVYVYSGKYSNLDAWDQFTQYIAFYDEVVDYDNERAPAPELYDVYYAYDPDTEKEAGQCVDEVIRIAEESGAEIQFY